MLTELKMGLLQAKPRQILSKFVHATKVSLYEEKEWDLALMGFRDGSLKVMTVRMLNY